MNPNYLRSFVLSSSILVVLPHYIAVAGLDENKINYTYKQYSFVAPFYYGIMNMLSLYLAITYQLSDRVRYIAIGIASPLIVTSFAYFFQTYSYTPQEWLRYGVGLFVKHFLIWNLVVYNLEKLV